MDAIQLLAVNAAITVVCFLILWLISIRLKDPSFIDSYWAAGIVILAISSFVQGGGSGPHRLALTGLCTIWGLRLGGYLFWRWRTHGADRRYRTMMGKAQSERGWGFAKASLLLVFALQAPLQFIVALPVQLGQAGAVDLPLGPIAWAGAVLAVAGILFESVGDAQLTAFKANPDNMGKVMDAGLWRYTRHPNYFGDTCVGWGLWLIAAETPYGLWSVVAPVLLTFLLTRWSGVPTVEGRLRRSRPGYEDYVARTSGFVPWFPKKAG
jgi:steroid 5-alpha reductase family enzyme